MFCSLWTKMSKRSFHSLAMFRYETMEVISSTILSVMKLLFSIHIIYICSLNWILKQHLIYRLNALLLYMMFQMFGISLRFLKCVMYSICFYQNWEALVLCFQKKRKHWSLNTSCCKYNLHFWCQDQKGHEAILKMLGLARLALWIFWIKTQLVKGMYHLCYFVSFLLPICNMQLSYRA
jgi:hypothetical protein